MDDKRVELRGADGRSETPQGRRKQRVQHYPLVRSLSRTWDLGPTHNGRDNSPCNNRRRLLSRNVEKFRALASFPFFFSPPQSRSCPLSSSPSLSLSLSLSPFLSLTSRTISWNASHNFLSTSLRMTRRTGRNVKSNDKMSTYFSFLSPKFYISSCNIYTCIFAKRLKFIYSYFCTFV